MGYAAVSLLGFGLVFDALSLMYGILSLRAARVMSGFLFAALPFYAFGVMILPGATLLRAGPEEDGFLVRIAMIAALCLFHAACNLPGFIAVRRRVQR